MAAAVQSVGTAGRPAGADVGGGVRLARGSRRPAPRPWEDVDSFRGQKGKISADVAPLSDQYGRVSDVEAAFAEKADGEKKGPSVDSRDGGGAQAARA